MRAKKSLGQNFLTDQTYIGRIITAAHLSAGDHVLEIGPGRGALTGPILETQAELTALEFDRDMVAVLNTLFGSRPKLKIVRADALSAELAALVPPGTKVIANLPYNISTPILQKLSDERSHFSMMVLMFQREVVDRITAGAGNSERGFLSVIAQRSFSIEHLFDVPPTAFRPAPKVWSSVIRLTPLKTPGVDEMAFRKVVSRAFAFRRKTILNNLKGYYPNATGLLEASGIEHGRRAETLDMPEWERLAENVAKEKSREL